MRVLPFVILLAACTKPGDDTDPETGDSDDGFADGCILVDGAGGYALLGDALSVAKDGSTVTLCEGTWTGSVELAKSVTIEGAGAETTIWEADVNKPVVTVPAGVSVTFKGIGFSSTLSGILATGGSVTVSDSTFVDMGNYAIRASDADVTVTAVTVDNAQYGGVRVSGGSLTMSDSTVTGCVGYGVTVEDGATGTLTNNVITSTIYEAADDITDGYAVKASGLTTVTMSGNHVGGNQYGDVLAEAGATVIMNGDTLSGSLIGVFLDTGSAELHDVVLSDYLLYGIVAQTTMPVVLDNTVIATTHEGSSAQSAPYSDDSAFSGSFGVLAFGANVTMTGGSISGNNGGGFYQNTGSATDVSVTATGTVIDDNARFGMVTFGGLMDLTDVIISNTLDDDASCYDESNNIICNIALAAWTSDLTMHGGEIRHNASFGLAPIFDSAEITGTLLTENSGYAMFGYAAAVTLDGVTFDANGLNDGSVTTVPSYSLYLNQNSTVLVKNSTFSNGSATSVSEYTDPESGDVQRYVSYYQGHDAFVYGSTLIIEDTEFKDGQEGIVSYSGSSTQITNSTFSGYDGQPIYTYDSDLVLTRTNFTDTGDSPVYCYLSNMSLDRVKIDGVSTYPYKYEVYYNGELSYSYEYEFSGTALQGQRCETSLENVEVTNVEYGGIRFYDSTLEMDGVSVSGYTAGYGYDGAIDIQYSTTNPDVILNDITVSDVTAGYGVRVYGSHDYDYDGTDNASDTDCDGDGTENSADTDDQNDCAGGLVQIADVVVSNIGYNDPDTGVTSDGVGLYLYQLDKVLVEGISVSGVTSHGIYTYDVDGDLVGDDGTVNGSISAPGENGIKVEGGVLDLSGFTITSAGESGFVLVGGTSVLSGNTVTGAAEYGAECVDSPTFTGCDDNAFDGLLGETSACGCKGESSR